MMNDIHQINGLIGVVLVPSMTGFQQAKKCLSTQAQEF
jgi:hypothetical protein